MAAGIASQGILGASELLPRHRLQRINDEERLHRIKRWNVGRISRDFSEKMRASEWAIDRMKEASDLAAKEAEKMSIAQEIMLKSTDYLRRIIAPFGGQGGVTMSSLCPNCNCFLLEGCVWWVSAGKKYTSQWCAVCGEKYDWKQPNREDCVWWVSAGKKYTRQWCAICGEKYDWKQPNRLLVVQTGERKS